jgi:predicted permease
VNWRQRREHDLEREIRSDLELETQELIARGLSPADARAAAQRAFGNTTILKEEVRAMWGWTSIERSMARLCQDLRYAARMFVRNPGFVTIASLSLALGIGANAAMFALVNTLLIRPLPYVEADRLVRLTGVYPKAAIAMFQEQSRGMDIAAAAPGSEFNLTGMGETVRVMGSVVSDNLFSVLRAPVQIGRSFEPGEHRPGADGVVILSYRLWTTQFGGDPQAIGRTVTLNGMARQIVGVMPANFSFPSSSVQFWIPARLDPSGMEDYWGNQYFPLLARLRPGTTLPQAAGEVRSLMARLRPLFPFPMSRNWNADVTAIPLQTDMVGEFRGKLLVLFASVGIVLAIACANVASLLFSRASARRKEIALRVALGAGRWRIMRQLLTESVLLAALGSGLGLLVGAAALYVFKSVLPPDTPGIAGVRIDWPAAGFAAALALLTGFAFGLAPSLSASRTNLVGAIKSGSARTTTSAWSRIRSSLIVGEVSLTVLLVVSAGLLLKSLYVMSQVNPGFSPEHVLTLRISPNQSACVPRERCVSLYDRLLSEARGISGVSDVAIANTVPLDGQLPSIPVDVEDHPKTADFPAPMFWTGAVSPDYFRMLHIPLLTGREFSTSDGMKASAVAIVTSSTARRFWPNQSAVGKHVKATFETQWRTVVGVVSDVRQFNLAGRNPESITGAFYLPYAQAVQGDHQLPAAVNLLATVAGPPARVAGEMRRMARELNPNVPVSETATLEDVVSRSIADFQSTIWLFLSFAAVSVLLAAVGIYGLVSNSVAQRTHEIGLRMAIGATRPEILKLMLGQSLRLALMGIVAGVAGSIVLTRFLASLLYGVGATDPAIFAGVCGLMLGIAVLASYVPAWRAANLDPVRSLHAE